MTTLAVKQQTLVMEVDIGSSNSKPDPLPGPHICYWYTWETRKMRLHAIRPKVVVLMRRHIPGQMGDNIPFEPLFDLIVLNRARSQLSVTHLLLAESEHRAKSRIHKQKLSFQVFQCNSEWTCFKHLVEERYLSFHSVSFVRIHGEGYTPISA